MSMLSERLEALGEAIEQDPRRVAWMAAKEAQEQDEALQAQLEQFNTVRDKLMAANMEDPTNEALHKDLGAQMKEVYETIMQNPKMTAFLEAQEALTEMVNEINNRIQFFLTGQEPVACDGNCASCGSSCG
ncbi:MAG: YlbF family regulator [Clostridia bacterium]|nr:YlbF family regulator [Clostridia bacterium]